MISIDNFKENNLSLPCLTALHGAQLFVALYLRFEEKDGSN